MRFAPSAKSGWLLIKCLRWSNSARSCRRPRSAKCCGASWWKMKRASRPHLWILHDPSRTPLRPCVLCVFALKFLQTWRKRITAGRIRLYLIMCDALPTPGRAIEHRFQHRAQVGDAAGADHPIPQRLELLPTSGVGQVARFDRPATAWSRPRGRCSPTDRSRDRLASSRLPVLRG